LARLPYRARLTPYWATLTYRGNLNLRARLEDRRSDADPALTGGCSRPATRVRPRCTAVQRPTGTIGCSVLARACVRPAAEPGPVPAVHVSARSGIHESKRHCPGLGGPCHSLTRRGTGIVGELTCVLERGRGIWIARHLVRVAFSGPSYRRLPGSWCRGIRSRVW
jgi:ribosomal protein S14